jgi:hypothetical protein
VGEYHVWLERHQFGDDLSGPLCVVLRPADVQPYILLVGPTKLTKTLQEGFQTGLTQGICVVASHQHRNTANGLLGAHGKGARRDRYTSDETDDEFASSQVCPQGQGQAL